MRNDLQRLLDFKRSYEPEKREHVESDIFLHNNKLISGNDIVNKSAPESMRVLSRVNIFGENYSPLFEKSLMSSYFEIWNLLIEHHNNPLSSLVSSKTMLLPHQVQAALQIVESLQPRALIADEVGLGKTIETGLIIKELILKYNFNKVLIAVPAPLLHQWKAELHDKFNEKFLIIDGSVLRKNPDVLEDADRVIVSIDLLKIPVYWDKFLNKSFDIVVFDEAHRLRKDETKATRAYQFAEKISKNCRALLLLSATPFRGKLEEIYYLIQLIDPDILGPYHTFYAEYVETAGESLRKKLAPVVIRRRKGDVGGFTRRFARTVRLNLDALERGFYDAVTEYVKKEYNRAVDSRQHVKAFVMVIFQKLLDSSSYALLAALEKRKDRLEQMYFRIKSGERNPELSIFDEEDLINLEDDEDDIIDLGPEQIFDPKEVRQEIFALTRLIQLGKKIDLDMKLKITSRTIAAMRKEGHKKILIFTQFVNTMKYVAEHLGKEFQVTVFHGGLSAMEKEKAIVEFFENTDILICTEAGGEGRNLQVATALINYDLPWSPLKIEQRIGRIHRFGQKSDVYVINFATKDTIAEKVLEIIERKIKLFEDAFGESDVLLGTSEDDKSFEKSVQNLLREKKTVKEIEEEVEKSTQLAKKNVKKIDTLLTTEVLDFNMSAFSKVLRKKEMIGDREKKIKKIMNGVEKSEPGIFKINNSMVTFTLDNQIKTGSFDFEICGDNGLMDYLTIGHELVDRAIDRLSAKVEERTVYFAKSETPGIIGFFQAHIYLDRVYNRFYTIYYNKNTGVMEFEIPSYNSKWQFEERKFEYKTIESDVNKILAEVHEKIMEDVEKIHKKLNYSFDYWKKNMNNSHYNRELELKEKLEIQRGKAKWYGDDKMTGAISRTINQQMDEKKKWREKIVSLEQKLNLKVDLSIRHLLILE
jgi:SNF2 family DNA or RNA helicase